jgi:hypothetical protein
MRCQHVAGGNCLVDGCNLSFMDRAQFVAHTLGHYVSYRVRQQDRMDDEDLPDHLSPPQHEEWNDGDAVPPLELPPAPQENDAADDGDPQYDSEPEPEPDLVYDIFNDQLQADGRSILEGKQIHTSRYNLILTPHHTMPHT